MAKKPQQIISAVAFVLLFGLSCCFGEVVVFDNYRNKTHRFAGWPAQFGNFEVGIEGWLQAVHPQNACSPLPPVPNPTHPHQRPYIALVSRGDCDFEVKAYHAQEAQYRGIIVKNYNNDQLFNMAGGKRGDDIFIPAVLVTFDTGNRLNSTYLHKLNPNITVELDDYYVPPEWHIYLYPFVIIVGVCVFLLVVFMFIRYRREHRSEQRRRLPRVNLNKLPTKKWRKGEDNYETCAICLDDYNEGDKLRILPCQHAYHCKCVDKWLTSRSRTCPVCKFSIGSDDCDSDSEAQRQQRRRRRRRPRPTAAAVLTDSDSLSGNSGDEEHAPLVTRLSSSSGEYGARGHSGANASVISSPFRSGIIVTDSDSDVEAGRSPRHILSISTTNAPSASANDTPSTIHTAV